MPGKLSPYPMSLYTVEPPRSGTLRSGHDFYEILQIILLLVLELLRILVINITLN